MDLKDATLMLLSESDGHPAVASLAKSAHDLLARGEAVDYRLLDDLIGEASGKGVLRALHARYSPVAYEAIIGPILTEIGRQKPVPPRRRAAADNTEPDDTEPDNTEPGDTEPDNTGADPLRASVWPPR
jgi:hypothetical protein